MGSISYYNINGIYKANYNNIDNYTIKPFFSKNEDFLNDSFSLFKASRFSPFNNYNNSFGFGEEYKYRSEASENHFTPYNSGFQPFPSQNLNNLEVAQLQPPKQENIIPYDRNTITDRMGHTEIPFAQYNSDFQPFPSPNLNKSEYNYSHQNKRILFHMKEIRLLTE